LKGLIVLSGSLLALGRWLPLMRKRSWPVFVSHGTSDPILPFSLARRLADEFERAAPDGAPAVRFVAFEGQHGIPLVVLSQLKEFLAKGTSSDVER
jgi:predicted esterase